DGSPSSGPGSVSSRTPSPLPFPTISPLRSAPSLSVPSSCRNLISTKDQSLAHEHSPETIVSNSLTHGVEADIFFSNRDPKDEMFQSMQNGKQLPDWVWKQPDYDFVLQLGSLDLGDRITSLYNGVRKQTGLDHTKVDQIALLSGILHICDGNFGLSSADTAILHNAVVDSFYSRELAMADLDRARNSEDIWSTWVRHEFNDTCGSGKKD
ncbi:hypothetical protein BGX29_002447, partial [Mortierella sp. GBA35]